MSPSSNHSHLEVAPFIRRKRQLDSHIRTALALDIDKNRRFRQFLPLAPRNADTEALYAATGSVPNVKGRSRDGREFCLRPR